MAESLVNTKRRINTIKSTEKITKAMKLVASVKYQRWKKYYDDNLFYTSAMKDTLSRLLTEEFVPNKKKSPLFYEGESENILYVVISSSLGLCGSYNYNLFKALDPILKDNDELILIGNKGLIHYQNKQYKFNDEYVDILDKFSYSYVKRLRHYIIREFKSGKYKKVMFVYTRYQNSITFIPTLHQLLPFDKGIEGIKESDDIATPLFEPSQEELINSILPHYIDATIYNKLIETNLSELASRRNAMDSANDSADKILNQLLLEYNKQRQNAITQEITEVVAGANAGRNDE